MTSLRSSPTITPFLWFPSNAEQAVAFYTAIFPGSRVLASTRYGDNPYMPKGSIMTVSFELAGQRFTALNGGPAFTFNESVSFVITCDTQAEIDHYWDKLTNDGGKPVQSGWLKDRFGLSWQVLPAALPSLLANPDTAPRVLQALALMTKPDIATLESASRGTGF